MIGSATPGALGRYRHLIVNSVNGTELNRTAEAIAAARRMGELFAADLAELQPVFAVQCRNTYPKACASK